MNRFWFHRLEVPASPALAEMKIDWHATRLVFPVTDLQMKVHSVPPSKRGSHQLPPASCLMISHRKGFDVLIVL